VQFRYHYALAVYHGNRTFDGFATGGVVACAVLACTNLDVATCGVRDETLGFAHQWRDLEVTGEFPYGDDFFYLPSTLDESVMPFGVNEFNYTLGEYNSK
jgi:pantetheine hydrolase